MTDPQNSQNPHGPGQGHPGQAGQPPQYGAPQTPGQPYGQTPPGGAQYGQAPYGVPPQPYPPQPYPAPPAGKKKKKWPWILGALVVLLIIILAATSGGGSEDTDTTADSGASTASQNPTATETSAMERPSAPAETPAETQAPAGPDLSSEQKNAVAKAEDYLSISGFSRPGLIKQLEFEGYSNADAVVAVDKLEADGDVNWNEQAAKKAAEYQSVTPMSRQGLVQQLEFEGFTPEQAAYGAGNAES